MKHNLRTGLMTFGVALSLFIWSGCAGSSQQVSTQNTLTNSSNLDTVKAKRFDTGKMWTFDNPPVKYFQETYGFTPSEEWLSKARKSALRFGGFCSASFVSEDGLVMTNHHCGRSAVTDVNKEGEDLHKTGFFAQTLDEERPVKGLFVDQLMLIKDITKEVQNAMNSGKTDEEKIAARTAKMREIEANCKKDTGLEGQVVTLYNGGEYSLYGYKRYTDVRLVFAPENELGFFGGDYDNFTYPRYDLDCTFFRVYDENGKPIKTENYFKWSPKGASEGDPVFVIGNPGRTTRLNTVAQLEYSRDISYPTTLTMLNNMISTYTQYVKDHPDQKMKYDDMIFGLSNSQKVYIGMIKGLNDPILMQRKRDFENKFKAAVAANPELQSKYGMVWDGIVQSRNEMRQYSKELMAFSTVNDQRSAPVYYRMAKSLIALAQQMQKPEADREPKYKADQLESTISKIVPADFNAELAAKTLAYQINSFTAALGADNEMVKKAFGGKTGSDAAQYMLSKSALASKESVEALAKKDPQQILNSDDPFVYLVQATSPKYDELTAKVRDLQNKERVSQQLLGQALFAVYGTSIPPDANMTLRLADGVVKGYDYNGTTAPAKTTFYGLYDRYFSFDKKTPFELPERWKTPPAEFNLETPMNFVSTNDIIGGNSGSPVVSKNLEIVGLVFDGNIESLPGDFIYDSEYQRAVSVASEGLMEAIKDMYKAKRISDELATGKMTPAK